MPISSHKILAIAAAATAFAAGAPAHAVARPSAIDWDAPPPAFVSSLYAGVLGRAPESAAVIGGWASQISSDPRSRLNVFHGFINSAEYRGRYGGTSGQWGLHYRIQGNRVRWMAATNANGWHTQRNGLSQGYARALVGYYNTYASRR